MSVGRALLNVPFSEMVSSMATAIAESQFKLDRNSVDILKVMGNKEEAPVYIPTFKIVETGNDLGLEKDSSGHALTEGDEIITSMIGAGFQPTFYQFAETIIEVKMDITVTRESEYENKIKGERKTIRSKGTWWGYHRTTITSTPVDASYSSKYNYTTEGSSMLRTRLVPMPPNTYIQRIIDIRAEAMRMLMDIELKKVELAIELEKAKSATEIKKLEENADESMKKIEEDEVT